MRQLLFNVLVFTLMAGFASLLAQKAPEQVVFQSKMGNVTFDHALHAKRVNGDCKSCHDTLFARSSSASINFRAGLHKTAEAAKASCGGCHNPGGAAFETKGNCAKCHVK